jgi:hypothetical protein
MAVPMGLALAMAGCHQGGRHHAWLRGSDPASIDARTAERLGSAAPMSGDGVVDDGPETSQRVTEELSRETKGFFRPTRRAGTLSSEAAEIEKNLGVPR